MEYQYRWIIRPSSLMGDSAKRHLFCVCLPGYKGPDGCTIIKYAVLQRRKLGTDEWIDCFEKDVLA